MVDSGVRAWPDLPHLTGGPVPDLIASKLRPPPARPGMIGRFSLIERLARDEGRPIVSVVAPAGYGKTTLLAQWAERSSRAFAWVSVDEQDNDAKILLTYVAAALDAIEPVGERVFDALASPASSVPGSVVPRLGAALASMITPVMLVLDDVHVLSNSECRAALSVLADHVPRGSQLVLAGRDQPPLRVARLRAERRISEVGPDDLALTVQEAARLLHGAGVMLGADDLADLHKRTEGWAVGLYLAALAVKAGGGPRAAQSFGGDDRFVSDYVESELLARISPAQRMFLTRTAILERMSGPLCEALVDQPGTAATLAALAQSNLLVVPLDHRCRWYRYHHLFRDMLLAELHRREPALIPVLRRRAAAWCVRNDLPEEALEYSITAGDVEAVAGLVEKLVVQTYRQGRGTTLWRWLAWLDGRGALERYPMVAVMAASLSADRGRPAEADRFADMVDRWQHQDADRADDPSGEAYAAMLRAMLCRHGAGQMRADSDEAMRRCAAAGIVSPTPARYLGIACVLCGDSEGGDASFQTAASAAEGTGAQEELAIALSERALLAMGRGDWECAEVLAADAGGALQRAGLEDSYTMPLASAAQARVALHRGDAEAARQQLNSAQRARPLLTYAMPHVSVQARIELARVHLALADLPAARTLMREINDLLRQRPGLGTLVGQAEALRAQLSRQHGTAAPRASALTAAELRLLPLLSTHLTAAEIGAELFLSPHTIKAEVKSIYRKLDASSRNQAITRARDLGLLEE
jgi:LuxR family transcriptional regulator, maltose regulon positive regulatory protein